jgi:hypothetical protein
MWLAYSTRVQYTCTWLCQVVTCVSVSCWKHDGWHPSSRSAFIQNSALSHPFLRRLVTKMKCSRVPVYGKMTAPKIEFSITALYPTATTEPVPRTPRTLRTVLLHCFQHKWELVAQTVITVNTECLDKLVKYSEHSNWSQDLPRTEHVQ